MIELPVSLAAWRDYPQFILYRLAPRGNGKVDKIPVDPFNGKKINAMEPLNWMSAETAIAFSNLNNLGYGIGFVLTDKDPFFFIDVDDCYNRTTWSQLAVELMKRFEGAAMEVSSSGKGLHIIGTGAVPSHKCRLSGLEFYTANRFIALTGTGARGNVAQDCTPALEWLLSTYTLEAPIVTTTEWSDRPVPSWNGCRDDETLLKLARKSKSFRAAAGHTATFEQLYTRDVEALSAVFPDTERDRPYNESDADAALAQHLAFWTGNDMERMKRLMLTSQLVRPKWDRPDYLKRTIVNACSQQHSWASVPVPTPIAPVSTGSITALPRVKGFLSLEEQVEHFKGCVYVMEEDRIFTPNYGLLNHARFRVVYGGHCFPLDAANERTTRDAWEAFTESQVNACPQVLRTCFEPQHETGEIIGVAINVYRAPTVRVVNGDPAPFLAHIHKLIPNEADRAILVAYMAAVVQYPGVKFQWCPFIQGVEGNGKTLLSSCLQYAVGYEYTAFPRAKEIIARFNGWLHHRLFASIDDAELGHQSDELMGSLKPMLTNEYQEIEPKGKDKTTEKIFCNFIINSNRKDGIAKTENDRRFAPIFTAQQIAADLIRDGMDGEYFETLVKWLNADGYAIVTEYLRNYAIPTHLNPAGRCNRAPTTTVVEEATQLSITPIQFEIMEAIAEGRQGFRNEWISSVALNTLLKNAGFRLNKSRLPALIKTMGFIAHPMLPMGRLNTSSKVACDSSGRPRLYIKATDAQALLATPAAVYEAYTRSQES